MRLDLSSLPMIYPPWPHQKQELLDAWDLEARGMLWGMRTGKTKALIDRAYALHSAGLIGAVLVVAPNGVHANWTSIELPKHAWRDVPTDAIFWSSAQHRSSADYRRRLVTLIDDDRSDALRWLSVNSEVLNMDKVQIAVKRLLRSLRGRGLLLAVDESDDFRRSGAKRTRLIRSLATRARYRNIMTGTAVLNSPLHAFSQFEILAKGALGFTSFGGFKERYAVETMLRRGDGRMYPSIAGYQNLDELRARIAEWASVVLREDVEGMPALLPVDCVVPLSDAQYKAYRDMARTMLVEVEGGVISALEGGVRALKLQQILGGFMYDDSGEAQSIDDNPPRLDLMWRHLESNLPGKAIVWCRFHEDIRRVRQRLEEEAGPGAVVEYHGRVSQAARMEHLAAFQRDPEVHFMVGQPRAGGRGLDMSVADLIVEYSLSHDAITRAQAMERATAVQGHHVDVVTMHTPGTVEDGILDVLEGRVAVADALAGRGLRDLLLATNPLR